MDRDLWDRSLLDVLSLVPDLDRVMYFVLAALAVVTVIATQLWVLRTRLAPRNPDPTLHPAALLPLQSRVLRPLSIAIIAMAFASIALVQLAARALDIPLDGGDRAVRYALQFVPATLLAMHAARARDATVAIVRSLREGALVGMLTCIGWSLTQNTRIDDTLAFTALLGAAGGFGAGLVLAPIAAGAAHHSRDSSHDAVDRMFALSASWLFAVGVATLVLLSGRSASNDRVVCMFPLVGSFVCAVPALLRDVARRGWIESVRNGRVVGWRITWRSVGSDAHEKLAPVRSSGEMDGVIEWGADGLGMPFRGTPSVPIALVSLRPAGPWFADGLVCWSAARAVLTLGVSFVALSRFLAAMA